MEWFKAAEGFLEAVDRTASTVAKTDVSPLPFIATTGTNATTTGLRSSQAVTGGSKLGAISKGGSKSKLTTGKPRTPTAASVSSSPTVAGSIGVTTSKAKVTATVSEEIVGSGSRIASSAAEDKPAAVDATGREKGAPKEDITPSDAVAEGSTARSLPAMVSADRLSLHSFLGGEGREDAEQKDTDEGANSESDITGSIDGGKAGVVEGQARRDSEHEISEGIGDPLLGAADGGEKQQVGDQGLGVSSSRNSDGSDSVSGAAVQAGSERGAQADEALAGSAETSTAGAVSASGAAAAATPAKAVPSSNGDAGEKTEEEGEEAVQGEDSSRLSAAAGAAAGASTVSAAATLAPSAAVGAESSSEASPAVPGDDAERGRVVKEGGVSGKAVQEGVQMTNGDVVEREEGSGEGRREGGGRHVATRAMEGVKPATVERELDEARGLLKAAPSSGQTKEARLQRICAQLSSRVQEYKAENEQLEELLEQERAARGSMDTVVSALERQLANARAEAEASEAANLQNLEAKSRELEQQGLALSEAQRQAAALEAKVAALQANTAAQTKSRDVTEARIIQALRDELAASERRFEEERAAHVTTRQSAASREIELEQRVTEGMSAMSRMQRLVDERSRKIASLEEKNAVLELECSSLTAELQAHEEQRQREAKKGGTGSAGAAGGGGGGEESSSNAAQIQAWKEEAERARKLHRESEGKFAAAEAQLQMLRVELEAAKRASEQAPMQANADLEKRFRELTDLLVSKQSQLEAMACEKQALVLRLEKEKRQGLESKAAAERASNRARSDSLVAASDDEGPAELQPLADRMPGLQDQRFGKRIEQAAKFLDRSTVTAGRFFWRRPLARLGLLLYLVFLHAWLMYLLHRLQDFADDAVQRDMRYSAAEAAAGLVRPRRGGSWRSRHLLGWE